MLNELQTIELAQLKLKMMALIMKGALPSSEEAKKVEEEIRKIDPHFGVRQ